MQTATAVIGLRDLTAPSQQWQDRKYCQQYAETWEIGTNELHYGWLASGENTVGLLRGFEIRGATGLDVGCGMGENLISLAKKGANCFGIDISGHMLRYARERSSKIVFVREDMREFTAFPNITFDLILSIYSLEYLESLKELRDVLANLYHRLRPGGTFVFCFSHPLQHYRHSMLRNESAISGSTDKSPLIYSFKDVVQCLDETGFTIDSIVEQETINPSLMSYEDGCKFPYHFHRGKNPCRSEFDVQSNAAPHTIIYKVKKPEGGTLLQRQMSLLMEFGKVRIWGEYRRICDSLAFRANNSKFEILRLEPKDAVAGVCSVMSFFVDRGDVRQGVCIRVAVQNEANKRSIFRNCLLGMISRRLRGYSLTATFHQDWIELPEHNKLLNSIFISRIDPIFAEFLNVFRREEIGVLVFVNGEEPGNGKVALDDFYPRLGDRIELVYVAFDRAQTAVGNFLKNDRQLDLFSFPLFARIP